MHLHKSIVWWSVWGLFVGIGVFGLREGGQHSIHLIAAIPILTGALAAAVLRLKHEYHEAMLHAKWVAVSTGFLLLGSGYLYIKAEAYGPFATGTTHKAFMGSTFEMSVHEVERALGHNLQAVNPDHAGSEGLKDWVFTTLPMFEEKNETRLLPDLVLYRVPAQARFDFISGKLGRLEIQFRPTASEDSTMLVRRLQDDLDKEYKHVDATTSPNDSSMSYRKEAVDAVISQTAVDAHHQQIAIVLQYLPYADKATAPLNVEAKAF